jgi:hypothetical protein
MRSDVALWGASAVLCEHMVPLHLSRCCLQANKQARHMGMRTASQHGHAG